MEKIEATNYHAMVKKREGHTCSFYVAVVLIIGMVLKFYLPVFFGTEGNFLSEYIIPLIPTLIFIFEILFVTLRDIRIPYRIIGMFLAVVFALGISFLATRSGAGKIFSLLSIIFGLYILYAEPLRKKERNIIFWFFTAAIALVLLNGTPGDAILDAAPWKFNPNNCAFLLAFLFCVCFTKLCTVFSWKDIVLATMCFLLQFFYISRTALLGELLFVLLSLVCRAWKNNSFSSRTVFWTILLFSLLGVVLAWLYAEILFPIVGYGKIMIFGKDIFTGRQTIWDFAFDSIREHFWFGVGSHLNEAQFKAGYNEWIMNAHNQAVGTLAAFGIIAFVLFYIAFAFFAAQPYHGEKKIKASRFPAIFLLSVTIMSYFEVYFFSEYDWIAILIAYGLILSQSVKEKA